MHPQRPIIETDAPDVDARRGAQAHSARREEWRGISLRLRREAASAGAFAQDSTGNHAAPPVVMLDSGRVPVPEFTGITHHDREASARLIGRLELTRALGAEMLVLPAVNVDAVAGAAFSYADCLSHLYRLLCAARHEAEQRGVMILIDAPAERFLLSPVETADLLARVASPFLGVRLSLSNLHGIGTPADWIAELGWNVKALLFQSPCAELNWDDIAAALAAQRFDGSIVVTPDACTPDRINLWRSVGLWP